MQQDISQNETPPLPDQIPAKNVDALAQQGSKPGSDRQTEQQVGTQQPVSQETAELPEVVAPGQGKDSVLMVETISLPETAEALVPKEGPLGGNDLDMALPWYHSRWFYISAGIVAAALTSAGTILLIQGVRKRKRQRFLAMPMRTTLRQAPLRPLRGTPTRAQGRLNRLTDHLAETSGKRISQLHKQITRLTAQVMQPSGKMKAFQQQVSGAVTPSRAREQLEKSLQVTSRQLSTLGEKARATTARTASRVQQSLSSAGTSIGTRLSSGVARTSHTVQHTWKLGRAFILGIGSGAVWASLFTPESGEESRAHLAQTLQHFRNKGT